eukprot:1160817-Pelagomonas_calceolata.AAC.5
MNIISAPATAQWAHNQWALLLDNPTTSATLETGTYFATWTTVASYAPASARWAPAHGHQGSHGQEQTVLKTNCSQLGAAAPSWGQAALCTSCTQEPGKSWSGTDGS